MNRKLIDVLKNISYAILSNGIVFLSSTAISILIPALYSVSLYGYVQLYIFYTGYLGLFNIGWLEGIYLRLGGLDYSKINTPLYKREYRLFTVYVLCASAACSLMTFAFIDEGMRRTVFLGTSLCIIPCVLANYLVTLLITSGRMKEYARSFFVDRVSFLVLIIIMILTGRFHLTGFICADIFGKCAALFSAGLACRNLFQRQVPVVPFFEAVKDVWINISCGIKILIASLSSMFIIGVVRIGIEHTWSIEIYSQMSLTFSVSNMLIGFINAASQAVYTFLRRMSGNKLTSIYSMVRQLMVVALAGVMIFYYPLRVFLALILPKYEFGLRYMAILFPVCLIECKWSFLTFTYLKVVRKEKDVFYINLFSVMLSTICTVVNMLFIKDLATMAGGLVTILFIRGGMGEIVLAKYLGIKDIKKSILLEGLLVYSFILVSWNYNSWTCSILYLLIFLLYCLCNKKSLIECFQSLKRLMNKN